MRAQPQRGGEERGGFGSGGDGGGGDGGALHEKDREVGHGGDVVGLEEQGASIELARRAAVGGAEEVGDEWLKQKARRAWRTIRNERVSGNLQWRCYLLLRES